MIYKPTDLSPSAQTFDVKDTPVFFECKVDTSNVQARGFTIKILNSVNDVVFSSIPYDEDGVQKPLDIKYVTLIDDIRNYVGDGSTITYAGETRIGKFPQYVEGMNLVNTGYNGTYLKFPFSVAFADRGTAADGTVGINQIFYSETTPAEATTASGSGLYKYRKNPSGGPNFNAYEPVEIYNGQEYKWSITLYQLEKKNGQWILPENPVLFDMPLTTGTVLGSNNIRIQSVYSDEIYSDYFVQPVKIPGLNYDPENPTIWSFTGGTITQNNSNRALIKSYDMTYGYIYPATGENGFTEDTIIPGNADGFRVYKRGNDKENLTAYQQVSYVKDDGTYKWHWIDQNADDSLSYGSKKYEFNSEPSSPYKLGDDFGNFKFQGGERVIFNHQVKEYGSGSSEGSSNEIYLAAYEGGDSTDDNKYLGNPHNGIYSPTFTVYQNESTGKWTLETTWRRTPDADSWGELMTKIVLVTNPTSNYYGMNLQLKDINENSDAFGTLNQTPFMFKPEQPVEIYKNSYPVYTSGTYKKGDCVRWIKPGVYTEYSSGTNYKPGVVVYYGSYYYICIRATTGNTPSDDSVYWNRYLAHSYYVCQATPTSAAPISSGGVIQTGWTENPYLGNTGIIFYNKALTAVNSGRLYIRRFDGIQAGMMLMKNSTNNIQEYVIVKSYNQDYNFITYDTRYVYNSYQPYSQSDPANPNSYETDTNWVPANQVGEGTRYQIKTFFRESDENAFYFYTTPNVSLHYENINGVDFVEDRKPTIKYYKDYKDNIGEYGESVKYAPNDVVKYTPEGGTLGFYRNKTSDYIIGVAPTVTNSWEDVTSLWDGASSTDEYNKYFNYNKDDIVKYNNKNDFLLYNSSEEYNYGDCVKYGDYYYVSIADGNLDSPSSNKWVSVNTSDVDNLAPIYYIAMANITQTSTSNYLPTGENIGVYWQQYIGVLFENEGYVSAETYADNVKYSVGDVVLYKGLYYYVNRENQSFEPGDSVSNEHGQTVYEVSSGSDRDFDENTIYLKGEKFNYNGVVYEVVASSSGHVPAFNTGEFFIRAGNGEPLTYPVNDPSRFIMGDIVLGRGLSSNEVPDRYYVRTTSNTGGGTSSDLLPPSLYWDVYYGPMFFESITETNDQYNAVVFDKQSGFYYIRKNTKRSDEIKNPKDVPLWNTYTRYHANDIVLYNSEIYICIFENDVDTRPSVQGGKWRLYPWQIFVPEITERTLRVSAEYDQQQFVQWKSAQWFLLDETGEEVIEKSDVFYDGDLSYVFHGLSGREAANQKDVFFVVRLILETYNGYRLTMDSTIEVMFVVTEIDAEGLIDIAFDCDATAVLATITKASGFIIPSANADATYIEGDGGQNGVMQLKGEIEYSKVAASIENAAEISKANPIISAAERFVYQTSTKIASGLFEGDVLSLESLTESETQRGAFSIFLPEVLQESSVDYTGDSVLEEKTFLQLNPDRNILSWKRKLQSGAAFTDPKPVTLRDSALDGSNEELKYDEQSGNIQAFNSSPTIYPTVPLYQRNGFSLYDKTSYLPISYETVVVTKGDPEVDNVYFNSDMEFTLCNDGDFTSSTDDQAIQQFHMIHNPNVSKDQFLLSSNDEYSSDGAKYGTIEFAIGSTDQGSGGVTELRVCANTSTVWSDYNFIVPYSTLVGNGYYTKKNVLTRYGWKWNDTSDDTMWFDADYVSSPDGYQSLLGKISVNGNTIEEQWFDDDDNKGTISNPNYSQTKFKKQTKLDTSYKEREFLTKVPLVFDVDLTMDEDGWIYPTPNPSNDSSGELKVAAYGPKG